MKFIVTGLPRSRSAWIAAFLTDGPVFCHHELIRDCADASEFPRRFDATPGEIHGDSDTILPGFYPALREALRNVRFAFVWRDREDVISSALNAGAELGIYNIPRNKVIPATLEQGLSMIRYDYPDAPTWQYDQLEDEGAVRDLHAYCTQQPWNPDRFRLFHALRITSIYSKVMASQRLASPRIVEQVERALR